MTKIFEVWCSTGSWDDYTCWNYFFSASTREEVWILFKEYVEDNEKLEGDLVDANEVYFIWAEKGLRFDRSKGVKVLLDWSFDDAVDQRYATCVKIQEVKTLN